MDSKIIIDAFSELAKEKGIDKNQLTNIIEEVFMSLIEKKYGEDNVDKFSIIVNMERGEIEIYQEKEVVDVITNDLLEISIDKVKTIKRYISKVLVKKMIEPAIRKESLKLEEGGFIRLI